MKVLSEDGKKEVAVFTDWVNANSDDIPPVIVYPPKADDHHGGHEEHHPAEEPTPVHDAVEAMHEDMEEARIETREEIAEVRKPREVTQPEKWFRFAAVLGGLLVCFILTVTVANLPKFGSAEDPAVNEVMARYLESGLSETGAVNAVTGMILDYRAFDTLGESVVLFTSTVTVLFLLNLRDRKSDEDEGEVATKDYAGIASIPARVVVGITFPFILLYGIYIVLNGHLSPGGGFSGGAIIGGGLVLANLVFGQKFTDNFIDVNKCTKIMACGLFVYIGLKTYSILTGANGIESVIPLGTPGSILSSGLILPLNICVGLVVSCTVFALYSLFTNWNV